MSAPPPHRRRRTLLGAALPMALALTALPAATAVAATDASNAGDLAWMDTTLAPEERSDLLIDAMALEQKMQQLTGSAPEILPELPECYGARHVTGIEELAIPTLRISNGPVGVGQNDCVDPAILELPPEERPRGYPYVHESSAKATALPSAPTVAASFDPEVARMFGDVIGTEMNNLALHVFEAPGSNMARLPILGRNFEYFGEDPYLTGAMTVAETDAVQDNGLIAMPKHYAANEQETNRTIADSRVDESTLHETYLLPFEMAVKDADAASLMCAYNYVNGQSACENEYLLSDVLRDMWGFEGYVQSDFFATRSTVDTLLAGLDHMMPLPLQWSPALLADALEAGDIQESDIDTALDRRYTQMFKYGIFDRPLEVTPIDYEAGGEKARKIGTEGAVLLQNNGALPISSEVQDVIVIGKASQVYAQQAVAGGARVGEPFGSGGGSSDVVPVYSVAPVEGIENVLANLGNTSADVRLVLVDDANDTATIDGEETTFDAALTEAAGADAVVMMAGTIAEEGADRATFTDETGTELVEIGDGLDWYADHSNIIATVDGENPAKNSNTVDMIKAVMEVSAEEKTTLVLKDNAGVAMDPTLVGDQGPSILEVWFPGQEDGHIVADLLFGVDNPSGKSPFSYPYEGKGFLDHITTDQFPGVLEGDPVRIGFGGSGIEIPGRPTVKYTEGNNIGYRWYDANISGECETAEDGSNPCVAFPFGHGLSYAEFELSDLTVTPQVTDGTGPVQVELSVVNTGEVAGAEVPQVYLSLPESADEPAKRLVGFEKVELQPGEEKRVQITVDPAASHHPMSVWDAENDGWTTPEGTYGVHVGNAFGNLTLDDTVEVGDEESSTPPATTRYGFFLNDGWDAWADHVFQYGRFTDEVLIGDWDNDGIDTITMRRGNEFHVSNAQRGGDAETVFRYGRPGDTILVGDWDGDGADTLAVRRGADYHVMNTLAGGDADVVIRYGRPGDDVVVGDWDANGTDTLAVRRGSVYHVKNSIAGGHADTAFHYGRANDVVLAGDWDGDGHDTLAVRRGFTYHVKNSLAGGTADLVLNYGRAGDEVYVGDWNGDGTDTLGVRRTP